jgi:hypothetical protein
MKLNVTKKELKFLDVTDTIIIETRDKKLLKIKPIGKGFNISIDDIIYDVSDGTIKKIGTND